MNRYLERIVENFRRGGEARYCRMVSEVGDESISWADLEVDCRRFAAQYRALEIAPGEVVFIFLKHSRCLYSSFFGTMLAGLVPSFMPCPSAKQDPVRYWHSHAEVFQRSRPAAVVATADTFQQMHDSGLNLGDARLIDVDRLTQEQADFVIAPEAEIALLQHSSGTTGLKKGVALTYSTIVKQIESYRHELSLGDGDVIASWLPLYHDMGLIACLVMPTYTATPFAHLDPFYWVSDPETLFLEIEREKATLTWLPNFAFDHLTMSCSRTSGRYDLSSMRAFINCSEPCKGLTFDRFASGFVKSGVTPESLQCCYAMAETVFAVSQTRIGELVQRISVDPNHLNRGEMIRPVADGEGHELITVGKVIPGLSVDIYDEQRRKLAPRMVGEIGISGNFLFEGYNKDPERTARSIENDVYFSRDIGFIENNNLYVLGRVDDLIIINGRNVYAHEGEAGLAGISGIKPGRSVATSRFDERIGSEVLILICERNREAERPVPDIRREITDVLFSTLGVTPRRIEIVDEGWLVKTTSGKISRQANLDKLLSMTERQQA